MSWEQGASDILAPEEYQDVLADTDPELLSCVLRDCPLYQQPLTSADSTFNGNYYTTSTGPFPSRDDFPGPFDFAVLLGPDKTSKSKWTYSAILNKLYIVWDKIIPIQFKWTPQEPNFMVRALPVYTDAQDMRQAVVRCFLHSSPQDQTNEGFEFTNHVVRSDNPGAMYEENAGSKRTSVVVPLGELQPGTGTVTVTYKFMCKTTCATGMMRRPITVLFTLERPSGEVVGRQKLNVKICSCPKRDMEKDEASAKEKQEGGRKRMSLTTPGKLACKRIKTDVDDNPMQLSFQFEDREVYRKILTFTHGAVTSMLRLKPRPSAASAELAALLEYIEGKLRDLERDQGDL